MIGGTTRNISDVQHSSETHYQSEVRSYQHRVSTQTDSQDSGSRAGGQNYIHKNRSIDVSSGGAILIQQDGITAQGSFEESRANSV